MNPNQVANSVDLGAVLDPPCRENTINRLVVLGRLRALAIIGVVDDLERADVALLLPLVEGQGGVDHYAVEVHLFLTIL